MYPIVLENYLTRVQELSRTSMRHELLSFIEDAKAHVEDDPSIAAFFSGELALYDGKYETALEHYLKAQDVENYQFYCYRASAYLSYSYGNIDKAQKYIQKALDIYPDDYSSQELLQTLTQQPALSAETKAADPDPAKKAFNQEAYSLEETSKDTFMNTDATLCSYSSTSSPGARAILIQRLYPFEERSDQFPLSSLINEDNTRRTNYLRNGNAVQETPAALCVKTAEPGQGLESAVQRFTEYQSSYLSVYLQRAKEQSPLPDHSFFTFHGWDKQADVLQSSLQASSDVMRFLFAEQFRKPSGGYYIKWNQKGIVINPGRNFLSRFHKAGGHVSDIDYVIVTQEQFEEYADVKDIYELGVLMASESHDAGLIQYYLNPTAYHDLIGILKPQSKLERQAIHNLELFIDSPEVESVNLSLGIDLHFFPISQHPSLLHDFLRKHERKGTCAPTLGIRLELASPHNAPSGLASNINVGYISGAGWFPFAAHHFASCDVILAGVGNTGANDYNKIAHLDDCLGYYGISSLLEETNPKLLLCTEFSGREGDMRLEFVRKLRVESQNTKPDLKSRTTILPADSGLVLDLKSLKVKCTATGVQVDPVDVGIVRSAGFFGPLSYLCRPCLL